MRARTPRRMHRFTLATAAVSLLAACGGGSPTAASSTDPAVQSQLRQDVRSLAAAVAGQQWGPAATALAALDADAAAARTAGKIDGGQLARIRSAAAPLAADIARMTATPTPTVTVTVPAPDHGNGNGNGNGNGHGGD